MIENILTRNGFAVKTKITVKSFIAATLVILAVTLPQLVHLAVGESGGVKWLPMYLPVLLGGCLLGVWWGLGIGVASPIVSFLLTLAFGDPMPAAARLPFMIVELAVFATVCGVFSKRIGENGWMAFPAVLLAQVAGRAAFMLLAAVFMSVSSLTPQIAWAQIQTGLLALVIQAALVPFIVIAVKKATDN